MSRPPLIEDRAVHCVRTGTSYPEKPPYDPSESYPEIAKRTISGAPNPVFAGVRELLRSLGNDPDRYGASDWNPLSGIVRPGDRVILKPNLVSHRNLGERRYGLSDRTSLVTHGSVVRAVAEYVAIALRGSGRIVIGDSPIQGTSWDEIVALLHLDEIKRALEAAYPGVTIEYRDYRLGRARLAGRMVVERIVDESRRGEYEEVDLGARSLLVPIMGEGVRFGVAQYPLWRMERAHTPTTNLCLFPKEVLDADVVINLAKMKNHQKAGVTCALKNLVGINGHKDYLPHYRSGSPKSGGDEYPDGNPVWHLMWWASHHDWEIDSGRTKIAWLLAARAMQGIHELVLRGSPPSIGGGGWWGNDTLWRTILDINRAFFYFNRESRKVEESIDGRVRYLCVLDGVVGGEKESPLAPTPVPTGYLLAARNPVALDAVATALMGFDIEKVPQIREAFRLDELPLARFAWTEIDVMGDVAFKGIRDIYSQRHYLRYRPSIGFAGHVEYDGDRAASIAPQASPEGEIIQGEG